MAGRICEEGIINIGLTEISKRVNRGTWMFFERVDCLVARQLSIHKIYKGCLLLLGKLWKSPCSCCYHFHSSQQYPKDATIVARICRNWRSHCSGPSLLLLWAMTKPSSSQFQTAPVVAVRSFSATMISATSPSANITIFISFEPPFKIAHHLEARLRVIGVLVANFVE